MVWIALALSIVSLALSVWTLLRREPSRTSHIEIAPEVVQAKQVAHDAAWQRFEVHHRPAFERAFAERAKRTQQVK
jgi:hypothetical protein